MASTTRIRAARPEDARGIAEVGHASWSSAYRGLLPDELIVAQTIERRTAGWLTRVAEADPERRTWVVEEGGVLIAYSSSGPTRDARDEGDSEGTLLAVGEIYSLYVVPDSWGHGHGRALLAHAALDLFGRGFSELRLWVLATNERARRFYERNGFVLAEDDVDREFDGYTFAHSLYVRREPPA